MIFGGSKVMIKAPLIFGDLIITCSCSEPKRIMDEFKHEFFALTCLIINVKNRSSYSSLKQSTVKISNQPSSNQNPICDARLQDRSEE